MEAATTSSATLAAAAEAPPRPHVTAPELPPQRRELLQQLVRRLALEPRHQVADRHPRRDRHQQVTMVLADGPLQDQGVELAADLADQAPDADPDKPDQRRL